jgi:hypothetical protein
MGMNSKFGLRQDYNVLIDGVWADGDKGIKVTVVGIMTIAGVPDDYPIEEWTECLEETEKEAIRDGLWIAIMDEMFGEVSYLPESVIRIVGGDK